MEPLLVLSLHVAFWFVGAVKMSLRNSGQAGRQKEQKGVTKPIAKMILKVRTMDYTQMTALGYMLPQEQTSGEDCMIYFLFGVIVVITALILMLKIMLFLTGFSEELGYLNMEIRRTEGEERRYYIYLRRRLWLSLLPFIRY